MDPTRVHDSLFPDPAKLPAQVRKPAPHDIPFAELATPAFLVDERLLMGNLAHLRAVADAAGCRILLAQKAYSYFPTYPLVARYLDGTASSGLHEALLAHEFMPEREIHVFSPAYKDSDIDQLLDIADYLIFNSFGQWVHARERVRAHRVKTGKPQVGLRINPEYSEVGTDMYNPAAPYSRLGITAQAFAEGVDEHGLDGVDGLHLHTLCEENAGALINTWKAVEERFAPWLSKMSWFNLGGGHHITRADYRVDQLVELIRGIRDRYAVDVILEPGEAIPFDCGFLVSEVQDTLFNGMPIAILDVSAACHMPDVLEMPYQPHVFLLDKTADGVQYIMAVRCSDQG